MGTLTSWNRLGPSGPLTGLLYLYLYLYLYLLPTFYVSVLSDKGPPWPKYVRGILNVTTDYCTGLYFRITYTV